MYHTPVQSGALLGCCNVSGAVHFCSPPSPLLSLCSRNQHIYSPFRPIRPSSLPSLHLQAKDSRTQPSPSLQHPILTSQGGEDFVPCPGRSSDQRRCRRRSSCWRLWCGVMGDRWLLGVLSSIAKFSALRGWSHHHVTMSDSVPRPGIHSHRSPPHLQRQTNPQHHPLVCPQQLLCC